mgnify:CR=1 FL=1
MAYAILNNNQLYRVAIDDAAKTNLNINEPDYTIIDITDEEFHKLRKGEANITHSDGSYTVTDIDELKLVIKNHMNWLKDFKQDNENHPMINDIINYIQFLKEFDTSSVTYPMNQSFYDLIESQSQTTISPLQI